MNPLWNPYREFMLTYDKFLDTIWMLQQIKGKKSDKWNFWGSYVWCNSSPLWHSLGNWENHWTNHLSIQIFQSRKKEVLGLSSAVVKLFQYLLFILFSDSDELTISLQISQSQGASINYIDKQGGGSWSPKCQWYYISLFRFLSIWNDFAT